MKLTLREKKLLIVLAIVLCLFAYFKLIFIPEGQRITQLKQERESKNILIMKADRSDELLEDTVRELAELDSELDKYKKSLSASIHVPELLDRLITVAARLNVGVDNILFEGNSSVIKGEPIQNNIAADIDQQLSASLERAGKSVLGNDMLAGTALGNESAVFNGVSGNNMNDSLLDYAVTSFSFTGSFQACMEFLLYYETADAYSIIEQLELEQSSGICTGKTRIRAYSMRNQQGYKYNAKETGKRENPFE